MTDSAASTAASPQRLPPRSADVCDACGRRVYFAVRAQKPLADGTHRVEYLVCPVCGRRATRIAEIALTKRRAIVGGEII